MAYKETLENGQTIEYPTTKTFRNGVVVHGGSFDEDLSFLRKEVKKIAKVKVPKILEIGTWAGLTAFTMLEAADYNADITCVDYWWSESWSIPVLPTFINNIKKIGAESNIKIMFMKSSDALPMLKTDLFDLIFIDGGHRYQVCYDDIENAVPRLAKGGVLCGHDYAGRNEVAQAVDDYFKPEWKVETYQKCMWCVRGLNK
jgi:predicted O-methyltransferase YrrM